AFPGAEAFERPEHPQEDVLSEVLSLLIRAGKPVTDRVHTPGMDLHQVLPGGLLPAQAAFHQFIGGVQEWFQDLTRPSNSAPPWVGAGGRAAGRGNLSDCSKSRHCKRTFDPGSRTRL